MPPNDIPKSAQAINKPNNILRPTLVRRSLSMMLMLDTPSLVSFY